MAACDEKPTAGPGTTKAAKQCSLFCFIKSIQLIDLVPYNRVSSGHGPRIDSRLEFGNRTLTVVETADTTIIFVRKQLSTKNASTFSTSCVGLA
jgi:hypothetical protein